MRFQTGAGRVAPPPQGRLPAAFGALLVLCTGARGLLTKGPLSHPLPGLPQAAARVELGTGPLSCPAWPLGNLWPEMKGFPLSGFLASAQLCAGGGGDNQEKDPGAQSRGRTLPANLSKLLLSRPRQVSPEMARGELVTGSPGCPPGLAQGTEGGWNTNSQPGQESETRSLGRPRSPEEAQLRLRPDSSEWRGGGAVRAQWFAEIQEAACAPGAGTRGGHQGRAPAGTGQTSFSLILDALPPLPGPSSVR